MSIFFNYLKTELKHLSLAMRDTGFNVFMHLHVWSNLPSQLECKDVKSEILSIHLICFQLRPLR